MGEKVEVVQTGKVGIALLVAWLNSFMGWTVFLVFFLIVCFIMDVATGFAQAYRNGEWTSSTMRKGIIKKAGTFAIVAVAGVIDLTLYFVISELPIIYTDMPLMFMPVVTIWCILTELGSIIENAGRMGAPIPEFLKKGIAILQKNTEKKGNDIVDMLESEEK